MQEVLAGSMSLSSFSCSRKVVPKTNSSLCLIPVFFNLTLDLIRVFFWMSFSSYCCCLGWVRVFLSGQIFNTATKAKEVETMALTPYFIALWRILHILWRISPIAKAAPPSPSFSWERFLFPLPSSISIFLECSYRYVFCQQLVETQGTSCLS